MKGNKNWKTPFYLFSSATEKSRKIVISFDSGLQVRGDVFIKCYHKSNRPLARYTIFQLQFHTCTIESDQLTFEKNELDSANIGELNVYCKILFCKCHIHKHGFIINTLLK